MTTLIAEADRHACEWGSMCCGANEYDYAENICAQCHEFTDFMCVICEEERNEW